MKTNSDKIQAAKAFVDHINGWKPTNTEWRAKYMALRARLNVLETAWGTYQG